jgi:CII-binding regulator of phage lambda lysogenization HflD
MVELSEEQYNELINSCEDLKNGLAYKLNTMTNELHKKMNELTNYLINMSALANNNAFINNADYVESAIKTTIINLESVIALSQHSIISANQQFIIDSVDKIMNRH